MFKRTLAAAIALLAVIVSPFAFAQPLADKVPADALIYAGWAGTSNLGAAYDQSTMKAVRELSQFDDLVQRFIPQAIERLRKEMPDGDRKQFDEVVARVLKTGSILAKHPTAFYIGALDGKDADNPFPQVALICRAGPDAEALLAEFQRIVEDVPASPLELKATNYGGLVALTAGRRASFDALLGGPVKIAPSANLAADKQFSEGLARTLKDPASVLYINAKAGQETIWSVVDTNMPEQIAPRVAAVRKAAGLDAVEGIIVAGGFVGKDCATNVHIIAPKAKRAGITRLIDDRPLSTNIIKAIPESADRAFVTRLDGDLLAQIAIDIATAASDAENVTRVVNKVNRLAQFDVRKDLLAALGDEWAVYTDNKALGDSILSLVAVNQLRDEKAFKATLDKLVERANAEGGKALQGAPFQIKIRSVKLAGTTVYNLSLPYVSLCVAVDNGRAYFTLYTQTMITAIEQGKAAKSIADNPKFVAALKDLKSGPNGGFAYVDLQRTAPQSYGLVVMLAQIALGAGDMFGIDSPPVLLPPLEKLMPHLTPAAGVVWSDETGWYFKSRQPFPAATLLADINSQAIGALPLLAGIAMPAMLGARQQAMDISDMSNLRQIGVAIMIYRTDKDAWPATLGELTPKYVAPEVFISRQDPNHALPRDVKDVGKWVDENGVYAYIKPAGRPQDIANPADTVLAHTRLDHGHNGRVNVLFADGSVRSMPADELMRLLGKKGNPL